MSTGGIVIRIEGATAIVRFGGEDRRASMRGVLKSGRRVATHPIAVGDHVAVESDESGSLVIRSVTERRNLVARADPGDLQRSHTIAANVDLVVCVHAFRDPSLNFRSLDRFLLLARAADVPGLIVLNKLDLWKGDPPREIEAYRSIGYEIIPTSARNQVGTEALRARLGGRISLFVGPSGAGKSSLLNSMFPKLNLRTRPVNRATSRGVHTTVRIEWIDLPEGGAVLDTPGLRMVRPWSIAAASLAGAFPEFRDLPPCRFFDCLHRDEPDCAVQHALAHGRIAAFRYDSYLRILATLEARGHDGADGRRR